MLPIESRQNRCGISKWDQDLAVQTSSEKGVWYHIVMTWQKGERVIFYLNVCIEKIVAKGVSEDNNQDGGDNDFVIGSTNRDSKKSTYTAQMTLDELRVWDAAMSPGDGWAIYAADAFK